MNKKILLFAALFLVACVEFSSQDELTDVEAPALEQAADNDFKDPAIQEDGEEESEEDTEIEEEDAEEDPDEDEDSEETQEDTDLEDPTRKRRRRRCRRKCFYIRSCRRRACICLKRRRKAYDETVSDNEVSDEVADEEVEELEDTEDFEDPTKGKIPRRRFGRKRRRRCVKRVRKCFITRGGKWGLKKKRTCVRICLRRCRRYGDATANDS